MATAHLCDRSWSSEMVSAFRKRKERNPGTNSAFLSLLGHPTDFELSLIHSHRCQMFWGTSGMGEFRTQRLGKRNSTSRALSLTRFSSSPFETGFNMSWAGKVGPFLGSALWLYLGVLDNIQGVGLGMLLLQVRRVSFSSIFPLTFSLILLPSFFLRL